MEGAALQRGLTAVRLFAGPLISCGAARGSLDVLPAALLGVDAAGTICLRVDDTTAAHGGSTGGGGSTDGGGAEAWLAPLRACSSLELIELGGGGSRLLLLPGFVDAHSHAPQHAFAGTALDLPLLEWLETYTFPHEARFADSAHAAAVYARAVATHLKHGSTTVSYFATVHRAACDTLVAECRRQGQRALVGKVNMDRHAPPSLLEETEHSLAETRTFVRDVLALRDPLVTPVITPRFVPSCTERLMRGLAKIADAHCLPVQSHLGENVAECRWVRELHPEAASYADVYSRCGLLSSRSYMAHCIHCAAPERQLMHAAGAGVVHCPNSNFTLGSGVCRVREWLDEGHEVALGTDVAGGFSPSMLDALRAAKFASVAAATSTPAPAQGDDKGGTGDASAAGAASEAAAAAAALKPTRSSLSYAELFYLATQGGARVLGLGDRTGSLEVGKEFDALVVDPCAPHSIISASSAC
jgi:guanine deaminase